MIQTICWLILNFSGPGGRFPQRRMWTCCCCCTAALRCNIYSLSADNHAVITFIFHISIKMKQFSHNIIFLEINVFILTLAGVGSLNPCPATGVASSSRWAPDLGPVYHRGISRARPQLSSSINRPVTQETRVHLYLKCHCVQAPHTPNKASAALERTHELSTVSERWNDSAANRMQLHRKSSNLMNVQSAITAYFLFRLSRTPCYITNLFKLWMSALAGTSPLAALPPGSTDSKPLWNQKTCNLFPLHWRGLE